jgi:hypothetical protein
MAATDFVGPHPDWPKGRILPRDQMWARDAPATGPNAVSVSPSGLIINFSTSSRQLTPVAFSAASVTNVKLEFE